MSKTYKVVVTGAFNSGKTEFVRVASNIPVVNTERRISDDLARLKEETTVALDYGQARVGSTLLHLFGTPGQARFEFMREILSYEADAYVILVDSTDRSSLTVARRMLRRLSRNKSTPLLVGATKQDGRRPMTPQEIATSLRIDPAQVVACDAREKSSVNVVLRRLVDRLD